MSDEEILEKLLEFGEYLSRGTLFNDFIRTVGWWFILGMAWIVETLENVADTILGLRVFLENPEIQSFISQMQPLLIILFAFNILFIGYLLIFQKEFNRAGVFSNVFMALVIVVALGSGMEQGNEFTGDAIDAINVDEQETNTSMANSVIQNNITDVGMFDQEGWNTPELEDQNQIQSSHARDININSYLTEGSMVTAEEDLSDDGEAILGHKIVTFIDGSQAVEELEDGGWITDISQEYYYRYTVDWINLIGTLAVMSVVLITVSVKLASLFFELTFNYILAPFVAASDMHSGQRMKQMVQNILNIFLVTIMIFLSLKIYLIGTEFLGETLSGLPYLIAMIGLAVAVMNGPNIIERLFGIDAGGKGGLAALAGTYAIGKGAASMGGKLGKGAMGMASAGKRASTGAGGKNSQGGKENVSDAAKNKDENAASMKTQNGQGQEKNEQQSKEKQDTGQKENVAKQSEKGVKNGAGETSKGNGAGGTAAASGSSASGKNASEKQGKGQGKEESSAQQSSSPTSIHDDMDKSKSGEQAEGNSRPTSLHDEMNKKGKSETAKQGNKDISSGTGVSKGVGATGSAAASGGASASGNEGITASESGGEETGNQQMDQQSTSKETSSVSDQRQSKTGTTASKGVGATGSGAGSGNASASGGAQGGSASAGGSSGSGETKTSSVRNTQRQSGAYSGSAGKEIIEEQNEVIQEGGGGGSVEQERKTSTTVRQESTRGSTNVQQSASSGGSSSGGSAGTSGATPSGSASGGGGGGSATSGSRPTSSGGGQSTSTQKNTTRVSGDGGNVAPERHVIEEEDEIIQDSGSSSQPKQETIRKQKNTNKQVKPNSYPVGSNKRKDIRRNFKKTINRKK